MSTAGLPAALITQARDLIRTKLAIGFEVDEEIAEHVTELLEDEFDHPGIRDAVEHLTAELAELHQQEEESWAEPTDCDRLDSAFEALEEQGIVARQDFTCCGTCGQYEIGGEIAESVSAGREIRGYTFYHQQNSENAQECGSLYLSYGAVEPGEAAGIAIGQEVADTLRAHGFQVRWDGSIKQCIQVHGLVWKRRRGTIAPPVEDSRG